jgi:hypothetical protein
LTPSVIVGAVSRKLLATLATGPKTLGEIAIALYGADDYENRFTARHAIYHLRKNKGVAIKREMRYVWKRGQCHCDCPRLRQVYELVQDGKTVYELAAAIGTTDDRSIAQAQRLIIKLRNHGVKVDVEAKYVLREKGNP